MRVLIIDTTATPFTADSVGEKALGGIETATVELSRHLVALGHDVTVANQVTEPVLTGGVSWRPRPTIRDLAADVVIVNNDPRLFDEAPTAIRGGARRVVWLHNRLRIEKSVRKGHMRGFIQYRPEVVLLGTVHAADTSWLYPFRRRVCIPLGVSAEFVEGVEVTGTAVATGHLHIAGVSWVKGHGGAVARAYPASGSGCGIPRLYRQAGTG